MSIPTDSRAVILFYYSNGADRIHSAMIGTRLNHYEIQSHLGTGGMGEVYQAVDSKLGRSVAIKLLPEALTHDADRVARFEREARVLASLNHPNIAGIYGVEESGSRKFLVMELVAGDTLADRIKRGPIALEETLNIAKQIAEALEVAHEKGIIHRDLKPANVKITPTGKVKVLDFGLAKVSDNESPGADPSNSPTMMNATTPGIILGTAAYMSPEQARGKEAGRTADVWAFGCVVYEMLTGRQAFEGESAGEILGAIFKTDPDWSRLPAGTPEGIRRLLRRCLQKDEGLRIRDLRDARLEINESQTAKAETTDIATGATAGGMGRRWILAAGAAIVILAAAAGWWSSRSTNGLAARGGPTVVVLIDSPHPERVYDPETRKTGGTNADDLTDLLRDLPVVLLKENTNAAWHREHQVLQENPSLIVAHRSSFYDTTLFDPAKYGDVGHTNQFAELAHDKFDLFIGYIAQANPNTRFVVYSRGSWQDEAARAAWVTSIEERFPAIRGRVAAMKVPLDRATFRNATTGREMHKLIEDQLKAITVR
jgi:hypothetical protein